MKSLGYKDVKGQDIMEEDIIKFLWERDSCWGKAGTHTGYISFEKGTFEIIYINSEEMTVYVDFEDKYYKSIKTDEIEGFMKWSKNIEVIGKVSNNYELLKT